MSAIEFSRGDPAYHTFAVPAVNWTAGSKLFFAAKPAIDDDNTDANAVIQCSWGDGVVSDITIAGIAMKQYACTFPPSATSSILSKGADSADYIGEFQLVAPNGTPMTFPPKDPKLDVVVYFDIKRGTV